MKGHGTLAGADSGKPDALARKVANCDAMLNSVAEEKSAR
jgi:hypothetical protein